jgi:hypothetical protein
MKKISHILYSFCVLLPLILTSCGSKQKLQPKKNLKNLSAAAADYAETKDGVTLRVKKYSNREEASKILDKPLNKLPKGRKGVYPIQITIFNNSALPWTLSTDAINLETLNKEYVARLLCKNTTLPLFFKTGLLVGGFYAASLSLPYTPAIFVATCLGLFFIPGPTNARKYNTRVRHELAQVALPDELTMYPHQTANYLIFVDKRKFKPVFDVTLVGKSIEEISFKVDLQNGSCVL